METAPTAFPALSPRQSAAFAARSVETAHVGFLLMTEAIPYEDCRNLFSPETGQVSEILAWVAFPGLSSGDFDALEAAGLPLVRSGLGTWVWSDRFVPEAENGFLAAVAEALRGDRFNGPPAD